MEVLHGKEQHNQNKHGRSQDSTFNGDFGEQIAQIDRAQDAGKIIGDGYKSRVTLQSNVIKIQR